MKFNLMAAGKLALIATAAQLVVVQQGLASGFEKGIMWGGRSAGVGGIASPYIAGSQALYFNPAGLANDKEGQDVAFNLTLLQAKFKGPINNTNEQYESKDKMLTPLGLTYSYQANDRLGFGIGYFVSGGSNATYENIGMPTANNAAATASVKTDMLVSEISLGAGYKVTDDFKIGLAYRIVMAKAEFGLVQRVNGGAGFANPMLTDLKATDYSGFRLGAQYKLSDATKIGFNYRSEVNLSADGNVGGTVYPGALTPSTPIASNSATVKTTFPMQAQLGISHEYAEWRALAEYVWTQYSRVGDVEILGNISSAAGTNNGRTNVSMNWYDENQVRLGGEYLGYSWPIRFGYVWTSSVTNKDRARATFAPPASANTLTLGTGQIFQAFGNPLQFDIAGEYTFASADAGVSAANDTSTDFRAGTYAVNAMAAHLGLTYAF